MLLGWAISVAMLGWLNRLGGAVFGLVIGALGCSALLAMWAQFFGAGVLVHSGLARLLLDRFPTVLALLPAQFDAIRGFFR